MNYICLKDLLSVQLYAIAHIDRTTHVTMSSKTFKKQVKYIR